MDGPEAQQGSAGGAPRLRVFLSYSRKDSEFTARLASGLEARGYLPDFDRSTHNKDNVTTGISAEDDWWKRLQEMIEAADVMVLVVSPDSAASKVCDEEIAYARSLGKRVLPVLRRPVDFATAPPRLSALNIKIEMVDDARFDGDLAELSTALDRDVVWLREQTRLIQAAGDWERSGRREDELLRGAEISEAEAWSARRPVSAPEVPETVLAFLGASREAQSKREEAERRSLRRQSALQRWVGGLVAVALVVTLAGGWFVMQGQRQLARRESSVLANEAAQAFDAGRHDLAMRLGMIAARDTWLAPAANEARFELGRAAAASRLEMRFADVDGSGCIDVNADGSEVLATGGYIAGDIMASATFGWLLSRGKDGAWNKTQIPREVAPNSCARFGEGGKAVVLVQSDGLIGVWRPEGGSYQALEAGEGVKFEAPYMLKDGSVVAAAGGTAVVWTPEKDSWTWHLLPPAGDARFTLGGVSSLVVSDDGGTIARAFGDTVRVWSRTGPEEWVARSIKFSAARGGAKAEVAPMPGPVADPNTAIFADGWRLVSLTRDGHRMQLFDGKAVELWEQGAPGEWRMIDELPATDEEGEFNFAALSPDGTSEVVSRTGGLTLLQQLKSGRFGADEIGDKNPDFGRAVFSVDGKYVAASANSQFHIQSLADLNEFSTLTTRGGWAGAFSGDGKTLATAAVAGAGLEIWRLDADALAGGELVDSEDEDHIVDGAGFIADGRVFIASTDDGVKVWARAKDGAWTATPAITGRGWRPVAASGANLIATATSKALTLAEETPSGWTSTQLPDTPDIQWAAVSADGATVVAGSYKGGRVWTRTAQGFTPIRLADTGEIRAGAISGDGARIATVGPSEDLASRPLVLWTQLQNYGWRPTTIERNVDNASAVSMSRDGRRIAASGGKGIWIWTEGARGVWTSERVGGVDASAKTVDLSPDGLALATANDREARVWKRREDGRWTGVVVGGPADIAKDIRFSSDGKHVAILRNTGGVRIVDVGWMGLGQEHGQAGDRADVSQMMSSACSGKLAHAEGEPLRRVSAEDVAAAPILRGRQGEDVCAWRPAWYDGALDTLFGWVK